MDGVLVIDKPEGYTSHDVVARLRGILKTKRIGHTGTLDPFATGVLVMLVGRATRLAQFLDKDAKEYEAVVRFGFATDTGDRTGNRKDAQTRRRADAQTISMAGIETVLRDFRGAIEQTPPMYSAKKIAGKKLYELARKGVEVEREPIKISIYELELLDSQKLSDNTPEDVEDEKLKTKDRTLRVLCSAGTYIRTLAEDIGEKLGTGAHLAELRRTRAGKFDLEQAVTIEELETIVTENRLNNHLISMNRAVSHLPPVVLNEREIAETKNGRRRRIENADFADGRTVRMIDEAENLIAVGFYQAAEKSIRPTLVLV